MIVATIATMNCTVFQFACSLTIGFPLPFGLVFASWVWTPSIILQLVFLARVPLRQDPKFRRDFRNYRVVFLCQVSLTLVYPGYIHLFSILRGYAQSAFFLVLTMIKIAAKNCISRFLPALDDMMPEVVIFNIEIFHALYVGFALQNVKSLTTMVMVMIVDVVLLWLAVLDVNTLYDDLKKIKDAATRRKHPTRQTRPNDQTSYVRTCLQLLENHEVRNHPRLHNIRDRALVLLTGGDAAAQTTSVAPQVQESHSKQPRKKSFWPPVDLIGSATVHPLAPSAPDGAMVISNFHEYMTLDEKVDFVALMAQLLFMIEFAVLIEFAEVIVPAMYAVFIAVMAHLPNRAYYPQIGELGADRILANIQNILLYSSLEFLSFVFLVLLLSRKLHCSPLHQLTLVLDKQAAMVQFKLILWSFVAIQSSLFHYGYDFTMEFAWLHQSHNSTFTAT